jgi:hypothetical protein
MTAAALLAHVRARGAKLRVDGPDLVVLAPNGALDESDVTALRERKAELLELLRPARRFSTLRAGADGSTAELLDRFLTDEGIPLAVFRSHALGRDFVLARDPDALAALTEAHWSLPVLFFADCEHVATLGCEGLRVLLDLRAAFGPEVALREIRPTETIQ